MGRMRFIKENRLEKILEDKYEGNIFKLQQAENDLILFDKLNKMENSIISSTGNDMGDEFYCFDLLSNEIYAMNGKILLGMTVDQLYMKKFMYKNANNILTELKRKTSSKDDSKMKKIYNFIVNTLKTRQISSVNFNKSQDGKIDITSIQSDSIFGTSRQVFHAEPDMNISLNLNNDIKGKAKELLHNDMIYGFFMMMGINKFYIRCSCDQYKKYYNNKYNSGNFICSHCMNLLAIAPYYYYYNLGK